MYTNSTNLVKFLNSSIEEIHHNMNSRRLVYPSKLEMMTNELSITMHLPRQSGSTTALTTLSEMHKGYYWGYKNPGNVEIKDLPEVFEEPLVFIFDNMNEQKEIEIYKAIIDRYRRYDTFRYGFYPIVITCLTGKSF